MSRRDIDKTARERMQRVKVLVAKGLCNKEIEVRLGFRRSTVWHLVAKLYRQAGLYGKGDQRRFMVWILKGVV